MFKKISILSFFLFVFLRADFVLAAAPVCDPACIPDKQFCNYAPLSNTTNCADKKEVGGLCVSNEGCISGACYQSKCFAKENAGEPCGDNTCEKGKYCADLKLKACLDKKATGESCTANDQCVSGNCNFVEWKCAAGNTAPAVVNPKDNEIRLINPLDGEDSEGKEKGLVDLRVILGNIIGKVMGVLGSLTLVVFMAGGFMWLTAAGSPEKVKKGTGAMIWAVVGLFIIFSSYAILTMVFKALDGTGGSYDNVFISDGGIGGTEEGN